MKLGHLVVLGVGLYIAYRWWQKKNAGGANSKRSARTGMAAGY